MFFTILIKLEAKKTKYLNTGQMLLDRHRVFLSGSARPRPPLNTPPTAVGESEFGICKTIHQRAGGLKVECVGVGDSCVSKISIYKTNN